MPFDGQEAQFETPALRRAKLIEALRAPMPQGHEWNFCAVYEEEDCGTVGCAIGVAKLLGMPVEIYPPPQMNIIDPAQIAEVFGIGEHDVDRVFLSAADYHCRHGEVTPAMVADALEKLG